jgi:hypothetical protein
MMRRWRRWRGWPREALYAYAERAQGDFARFLRLSRGLGLAGLGRTAIRHLSFGAYATADGPLFARGVFHAETAAAARCRWPRLPRMCRTPGMPARVALRRRGACPAMDNVDAWLVQGPAP